jgi:RHS repeat-associated protein
LVPTRRYARYAEAHPVQPLKGLWEPRAASVSYRASVPAGHAGCEVATSYRALSPGGESLPCGIEENPSVTSALTANYSLLTANSSYTFSAKERDSETGYNYFGSRYYSSDLSIWLSVDPQSDKYASHVALPQPILNYEL